jgi:hypothetical protein
MIGVMAGRKLRRIQAGGPGLSFIKKRGKF